MPFIAHAFGFGGGPSKEERQGWNTVGGVGQQQVDLSKALGATGQQYTGLALPGYQNAMNYWQTLLGGDRTALSQFLGPEVGQIVTGNQNAVNTLAQFAPRGGARASAMAEVPFQTAQQIGTLYAQARPLAATQLGALSESAGKMGQGFASLGSSTLNSAADTYLGLLSSEQRRAIFRQQLQDQAGQALAKLAVGAYQNRK